MTIISPSSSPTSNPLCFSDMHNHPSGESSPSEADIKVICDLICGGQLLKIEMIDHVVNGNRTSLRELGYFYA